MPDQPTSPASTPPGQNLAGPEDHLVSLLVRDPRWASGPATGRDLETEPFQELLRQHLRAAGATFEELVTDEGEHAVRLALPPGGQIIATVKAWNFGVALAAHLIAIWNRFDEYVEEHDGGEE